jgi:hypothetical protein
MSSSKTSKASQNGMNREQALRLYKYLIKYQIILERGTRLDFESSYWHLPELRVEEIDIYEVICDVSFAMSLIIS